MQKGKFGFKLWVYPVLAMVCFLLNQVLLGALIAAFAIIAEKNEWLSRQVLEVFFYGLMGNICYRVVDWIRVIFSWGANYSIMGSIGNVVITILDIAVFALLAVFYIIGWGRLVKGQDAKIPLAHSIANRAFGIIPPAPQRPVPPPQPPMQQPPYQQTQAPYQAPVQPQQPQNPQNPQNPQYPHQ